MPRRESAIAGKGSGGRRTKIVATIGPASRSTGRLGELVAAGMDVARLNASHGTLADHARVLASIRGLERKLRRPIGVLLDLQGPKIRVGSLVEGGPVRLVPGARVVIEPGNFHGTAARLSTTYPWLAKDVRRGDMILLDDGLLRLRVTRVRRPAVEAEVVVGGLLREHKGMNLPGVQLSAPALTAKDRTDLRWGLSAGVDAVALSFVRSARDIEPLARAIHRELATTPIIAKIEKPEAVDRIDEILAAVPGIMVARGDLGVEMAPERVPSVQKELIRRANAAERLVITATQMLESMVNNPVPTRAEASDVANAIFDGTDAVMLSAETASGHYPVESVRMMGAIAADAEAHLGQAAPPAAAPPGTVAPSDRAMARAACSAAREAGVETIVVLTLSGRTALTISKMRPSSRIVAVTASLEVAGRMAFYRGVIPLVTRLASRTDRMIANAERELIRSGLVPRGETILLVAGATHAVGATNMVKLHTVGRRT